MKLPPKAQPTPVSGTPTPQLSSAPDAAPARARSGAMLLLYGTAIAAALGCAAVAAGVVHLPPFGSDTSPPAVAVATPQQVEPSDAQEQFGGYLGGWISAVTPEVAKSNASSSNTVFRVMDVYRGGPFDRAGVRVNDLVVAIDGLPVTDISYIDAKIRLSPLGQRLALTIDRDGVTQTVSVPVSRCLAKSKSDPTSRTCTAWSH